MFCEKCGIKNNDTNAFCENCGSSLEHVSKAQDRYCQGCGTKNSKGNTFCISCGQRLDDGNGSMQVNQTKQTNQHDANPHNVKRKEATNMPLVILLGVSALVLVVLIVFGALLLFRSFKAPAVEVVPEIEEMQQQVQMPTTIPTVIPTVAPTKEPVVEPIQEPVDDGQAVGVGAADEQVRESNPQRGDTKRPDAVMRNDFVFIDSDVVIITRGELDMLSDFQIRVARNELFARRGRIFESKDMKEYFENQVWYSGTIPAKPFDNNRGTYMNEIELKNMNIINKYEKDYGINQ